MIDLLFENGIVQIFVVLLAAPVWLPVVHAIWSEIERVGTEPRPSAQPGREPDALDLGSARRTGVGLWSHDPGGVWSKRRIVNPRWDRGRRAPRHGADAGPLHEPGVTRAAARESGSLTRRILENTKDLRGHGIGRRPL